MQALLDVILPVFLVIGFGYLAVWRKWFPTAGVDGLMKFTQNIAIPCLLFKALSTLDLGQSFDWRLLTSFYSGAFLCFLLGMMGARVLFKRDWQDSVAIGFCCLFSNSVMLGLAITERAYGAAALASNFAIVAMHAPFCYGVGITAMEIARNPGPISWGLAKTILKAMFNNALLIAILLGLFFNLFGLTLPNVAADALGMMTRVALPTALFAMGGVLYQYRPEGDIGPIAMVVIITLLVHPTLVWTFGTALDLSNAPFRSAVLTSAMAPGINTYVFANMYNRAKRVAASGVLISTGFSILTVWGWLHVIP
jgi:malonate transporter